MAADGISNNETELNWDNLVPTCYGLKSLLMSPFLCMASDDLQKAAESEV